MFKVPEEFRFKNVVDKANKQFATTKERDGNNGLFLIPYGGMILQCIASDGMEWEHVSVSHRFKNKLNYMMPGWDTMCYIKSLFWDEEDCVMQLHPPKSEYINNHPFVLHLWRPIGKEIPRPPSITVGI